MRMQRWWGPLLALTLAGCGAPAQPTAPAATEGATTPDRQVLSHDDWDDDWDRDRDFDDRDRDGRFARHRDRDRHDLREIHPIRVYSSSNYANTRPEDAVDGNTDTQWANGGYQEREGWLVLEFRGDPEIEAVDIKTGILPSGLRYRLEVSDDGHFWIPVTGRLTGDTWKLERVRVNDHGSFLRVHFRNDGDAPRFSVFEIEVLGSDDRFRDRRRDDFRRSGGYRINPQYDFFL